MHPPLVSASTAGACAVDHDLAMPERHRTAIEQASGTETIIYARHPSKRREEYQRWDSGKHDLVEHSACSGHEVVKQRKNRRALLQDKNLDNTVYVGNRRDQAVQIGGS